MLNLTTNGNDLNSSNSSIDDNLQQPSQPLQSLNFEDVYQNPQLQDNQQDDNNNCNDNTNNNGHIFTMVSIMNEMRKIGQLCDVILEAGGTDSDSEDNSHDLNGQINRPNDNNVGVDGKDGVGGANGGNKTKEIIQIQAHKLVLAANSSYFNAMFNNEMLEKTSKKIHIREVDPNALKLLVEFIYTGQLKITEANVLQLLPAASLLQLPRVQEVCCKFLRDQLHPANCLGINQFADRHCCPDLQQTSLCYARDNFPEVSKQDEFLQLSLENLITLINDDHLNVGNERIVYEATLRWIKYDPKKRSNYFPELLGHVRLPLIDRNYLLQQILQEPLIHGIGINGDDGVGEDNNQAKDLIIEAMRYHLSLENRGLHQPDHQQQQNRRIKHRQPLGLNKFIFAIGGGSLFTTHNECEYFDLRASTGSTNNNGGCWREFASTKQRRSRSGVTALNRQIYCIGGYNGAKTLSSVELYDPVENIWNDTIIPSMGTKRSCHGVAELHDIIYSVGGYDGVNCLSSAEKFDPLISAWFSVPSLEIKRRYTRLLAIEEIGCIYVVGGFDGSNHLSSVERFDPREGKWTAVAPMLSRRSSCGACITSDQKYLYVSGGNDGTLCMASVERYDPIRNAWENITSMQNRRSTHELVSFNGLLYALGGNDGSNSLNTVEYFQPETNQWFQTKTSMNLRRSGLAAIVMECCDLPTKQQLQQQRSRIDPTSVDSVGDASSSSPSSLDPVETLEKTPSPPLTSLPSTSTSTSLSTSSYSTSLLSKSSLDGF